MKRILWISIIVSLLLCLDACSKNRVANVLDDICRDIYENNAKRQDVGNLEDPAHEELPTYDQYKRERKE